MDIDATYIVQMGLFLFLLVSLNSIIIKPFLKIIIERDSKTEGAHDEVEVLNKQGAANQEAYQTQMREARKNAAKESEVIREEGREKEREILGTVRAEIADKLNAARQEVADAESLARSELASDTGAMARDLVSKVLAREVSA